jgi:2-methylcitrate dehydratase PrpD
MTAARSTEQLVAFGRSFRAGHLPAPAETVAKHCVLDWLAVTLAGAREPLTQVLYRQACPAADGGEAQLLGFGRRASVLSAALVHGTAAHALDYDDTHWGLQGHPTAPVLSALWGLAERERASGAQLLAALVAGVEVECRLGRWLNPDHYARGFHATATLGAFGAASAAAHLLGLDEHAWLHALGLAGTQAAGLKSAFGTMAKPLHVGRAAQNGLLAALLAADGFRGCEQIVEDAQGFVATHATLQPSAAEGPSGPEIAETLFKYHAACHLTHATIEALLSLQPLAADEIERIELVVDPTCLGVCAIERPRTGLEAKFSLKAAAAMALLGDATADPRAFHDQRTRAPELLALMAKVHVRLQPMAATRTELTVRLQGGRVLQAAHDSGVPERDLARQERRLLQKFQRIAPLTAAVRHELATRVLALDAQPDMRQLLATLHGT